MFLGIETLSSMGGLSMLNTTLLTAAGGLSFLVVDPLVKAIYALRCFYGESLRTGEDLKLDLKNCRPSHGVAALLPLLLIILLSLLSSNASSANEKPLMVAESKASSSSLSPQEVDRAISGVIGKAEYSWRMPREEHEKKADSGPFDEFILGIVDTIGQWLHPVKKWFGEVFRWIGEHLMKWAKINQEARSAQGGLTNSVYILLYVILAALACIPAVLLWRRWNKRVKKSTAILEATAIIQKPDILDEHVSADELPANSWMELAREFMEKGDLRLALRAFYLAGLSHLSSCGVITLAVFKSNRDYERELLRKFRDKPQLLTAFSQNTRLFESIWYGMHDVTGDIFDVFNDNQKRIMTFAEN
jgi:hypothetical protein